jgi:hypothetical protein
MRSYGNWSLKTPRPFVRTCCAAHAPPPETTPGGVRCIPVPIHVSEIDMLIKKKLLKENDRNDPEAIKIAICDLLFRLI